MTNPKWLIGLFAVFVAFTILSNIVEGVHGVEVGKLQVFFDPWPPRISYLVNFWNMLWFNYSFFKGAWLIVKYAVFWPISIGLIISFVATLITYVRGFLPV